MNKEVYSLNNDGVISKRQIPIQFGALHRLARYGLAIYEPPEKIPTLWRTCSGLPLSPLELPSFWMHNRRSLFPDVVPALEAAKAKDVEIYLNTGRSNQVDWNIMTRLRLGKVRNYMDGFYFCPKGIKGRISKIAGVAELLAKDYDQVTHADDNPADLLPMAKKFHHIPRFRGVLVRDWSTGILLHGVDMSEYPNLKIIDHFSQIFD